MSIKYRNSLQWPEAIWKNRELWWKLSRREVEGRYRGSIIGWGWTFITPLMMLAVYTFVFSQVFKARWGELDSGSPLIFAINLFTGLIVFTIFAETCNASPNAIISKANLVTKVIFPLEILPVVTVTAALFHGLTSLVVLIIFQIMSKGTVPLSMTWLPLVWLPLIGGCLSLSWFLSAIGVFLRDIGQVVGVTTSLLMFMSAVFYPLSSLPEKWQPILRLNPLITIIEQTRLICVEGTHPSITYLISGSLLSCIACEITFRCFLKARRGFADVL